MRSRPAKPTAAIWVAGRGAGMGSSGRGRAGTVLRSGGWPGWGCELGECPGQLVSPTPGSGDTEAELAASAGDAGGGAQQPVAELLRLGGGHLAVQQQGLGPDEQADELLHAGMRAVAGLQALRGSPTRDRGAGEKDQVAHAFVEVEQGQPGTGM